MHFFCKKTLAVAIAALTFSLAGCSESKPIQCTKVIEIINKGNALIDAQKGDNDATNTQKLAQQLKDTAKELEALRLTDNKLQGLQSRFVKTLLSLGQALADIGKAVETGKKVQTTLSGREQLNQAKSQLANAGQTANQLAEQQDGLTDELTNYCNSKD